MMTVKYRLETKKQIGNTKIRLETKKIGQKQSYEQGSAEISQRFSKTC